MSESRRNVGDIKQRGTSWISFNVRLGEVCVKVDFRTMLAHDGLLVQWCDPRMKACIE